MRSVASIGFVGLLGSALGLSVLAQNAEMLPEARAGKVWAYLQQQDYQQWSLWPGTDRFEEGTRPHGLLLTTYVNDSALTALRDGSGPLPRGSVIVKENYAAGRTLAAGATSLELRFHDQAGLAWSLYG